MYKFPEKVFNTLIKKTEILDIFIEVVTFNRLIKTL